MAYQRGASHLMPKAVPSLDIEVRDFMHLVSSWFVKRTVSRIFGHSVASTQTLRLVLIQATCMEM